MQSEGLLLQVGIADTGVIDGFQLLDKHSLGIGNVSEGDGTLLEIALCNLSVNELVDKFSDRLLRIIG